MNFTDPTGLSAHGEGCDPATDPECIAVTGQRPPRQRIIIYVMTFVFDMRGFLASLRYGGGGNSHFYEFVGVICDDANALTNKQKRKLVNSFTVPRFSPRATNEGLNLVTDPRFLVPTPFFGLWPPVPGGFVDVNFDADGMGGVNETKRIHIFYDGTIRRSLSEINGSLVVTTTGEGVNFSGFLARINETQGTALFQSLNRKMRAAAIKMNPKCDSGSGE